LHLYPAKHRFYNQKFQQFSFRVLQNYEVVNNSVTTNNDIFAHANREKEKLLMISPVDEITSYIIFRAVRDLSGGAVKKVNKRINKSFKRALLNKQKQDQVLAKSDNQIDEWEKIAIKSVHRQGSKR